MFWRPRLAWAKTSSSWGALCCPARCSLWGEGSSQPGRPCTPPSRSRFSLTPFLQSRRYPFLCPDWVAFTPTLGEGRQQWLLVQPAFGRRAGGGGGGRFVTAWKASVTSYCVGGLNFARRTHTVRQIGNCSGMCRICTVLLSEVPPESLLNL